MRFFQFNRLNKCDKLCASGRFQPSLFVICTNINACSDDSRQKLTAHCWPRNADSKQLLYQAQCVTPSVPFLFATESCTCFLRSRLHHSPPSSDKSVAITSISSVNRQFDFCLVDGFKSSTLYSVEIDFKALFDVVQFQWGINTIYLIFDLLFTWTSYLLRYSNFRFLRVTLRFRCYIYCDLRI